MTESSIEQSEPSSPKGPRSFWKSPWFWGILAGLIIIPAMRPFLKFEPPPPPVIGQLPPFELIDTTGNAFGLDDLDGTVWVFNFVFTRCTAICPILTYSMSKLDQRYRDEGVDGIRLISVSVDPEFDTPEVLREYGRPFGVEPSRWVMLTGPAADVRSLVVDGFKTAMDRSETVGEEMIDIAHTGKFVIVDGRGGIRGYYDHDELGLDEIFHRSQHVLGTQRR